MRSLRRISWLCLVSLGTLGPAIAVFGQATAPVTPRPSEPVAHRVYQRDANNRADIPIALDEEAGKTLLGATIHHMNPNGDVGEQLRDVKLHDGTLVGVPAGGPYGIMLQVEAKPKGTAHGTIGPIFVGDLWVLAGQSNMEGVGDLIDATPPHDHVMALGMDGTWHRAEEPLHWLVDSPDPVHSGNPADRAARADAAHKTRRKGAGLGLPFAVAMVEATGIPVGLVACAHGGTSMAQWDPAKKGEGGNSLYGSMIRQTTLAGGKFKGVLWYQGESDALSGGAEAYPKVFADFIAAVRKDLGQPDLPFYLVQIGRFVHASDWKGWNAVQEAQRLVPDRVPDTAVVSVIDLELDDAIHVGTQGLKRAGHRLARVAQHELFGQPHGTTPTLDKVTRGPGNTLVVRFKGVNAGNSLGGVTFGGGGMGGMGGGFRQMGMGGMGSMSASGFEPGLKPARHIAGFSIRKPDGSEIPLIFEAAVGKARDTVVLKLADETPPGAQLWYGWGLDPYCNLTDGLDMAVPVFGPVGLEF